MNLLKQKILKDGCVFGDDIIKVDSFLNHQIDVTLYNEIGKAFKERFSQYDITKILTIEASGIGLAAITAQYFNNIPVVFAKKTESLNLDSDIYSSEVFSFTKNKSYKIMVSKKYINPNDKLLIIDDFLANGKAILGMKEIIDQANATLVGAGIVIEKGFQEGGSILRSMGIQVESLASIKSIKDGIITFNN
ncbi:xanthine phosphoribosyltransferase [Alkalibaculum sp. M08DMB]|uniref:Xanthine phosphoribosyltransferase n=1 Tax=Alkalibaculum sporogenes TaxID=2655001 RepID=A0A6A7KB22_9FIRM|nr:xanthine phosphoribosyltransferase [Alkalibaculum sporogenes]MPW26223.1 xanthine phosphoribosyltransferase [Alkalibaculum sporogenes]